MRVFMDFILLVRQACEIGVDLRQDCGERRRYRRVQRGNGGAATGAEAQMKAGKDGYDINCAACHGRDGKGNEFLEFATALNVSAGGMLLAMRKVLPSRSQIRLEIPSAPVATLALMPRVSRSLRARALRNTPAEGYYLLGLKFSRPLLRPAEPNGVRRRKISSAV